jgi:hypothetical protein
MVKLKSSRLITKYIKPSAIIKPSITVNNPKDIKTTDNLRNLGSTDRLSIIDRLIV